MFMGMARLASQRATCFRLNVGALVVQDNNPISVGWNGHLPGAPHCGGNTCPGIIPGNCGTLHAEQNALTKAGNLLAMHSIVDLYVTHSPCLDCCQSILTDALDVHRIFFEIPYRNTSHLGMFQGKTAVYEVTPAGYIVEYFTRKVIELV